MVVGGLYILYSLKNNQLPIKNRRLVSARWNVDSDTRFWSWYLLWLSAEELLEYHHTVGPIDRMLRNCPRMIPGLGTNYVDVGGVIEGDEEQGEVCINTYTSVANF